jgi:DNA-binding response OmpR family regulator
MVLRSLSSSPESGGTTFASVCCRVLREGTATVSGKQLKGVRILVIEDDPDIREVLALLLNHEGADVTTAACGGDAAQAASQQRFDVVLSDLGLPDICGEHLIRQLRETTSRDARIIAITGYPEPRHARARQAGADSVFIKPLDWDRLVESIRPADLAA